MPPGSSTRVARAEASRRSIAEARTCSDWSVSDAPEPKIHRIHPYPAKFPAFIAKRAIDYGRERGIRVRTIADVFCGCGTVALEAQRAGVDFWGCDINPVATLIAKAKSESFSAETIERHADQICRTFRAADHGVALAPVAEARLRYWYPERQFADLSRLLLALRHETSPRSKYRWLFECAFSAILKNTSMWKQRSIKPSYDSDKRPAEVLAAFVKQCIFIAAACREATHSGPRADSQIVNESVLAKRPSAPKADLIVTSPPYVTSYEYADIHQLSSLWLGFAEDYRDLRKGAIGSARTDIKFSREYKRLNESGTRTVFSVYGVSPAIARSTLNYFLDMQVVAGRCYDILRLGGAAIFVVGNTEYRGVKIDNATHLFESLRVAGFGEINVAKRAIINKAHTPYRGQDGRLSRVPDVKNIYSEEFILMAHK